MPQFVYYVASSLDGYIAEANGSVDFLNRFHDVDYGIGKFAKSIDCVVFGRTTYEQSLTFGPPPMKKRTVVLSSQRKSGDYVDEFWSGSLPDLATHLDDTGSKRVWMMGGGVTASSFLEAGFLDELWLHVMPVVLGTGIPLFARGGGTAKFSLAESRTFPNSVLFLRYEHQAFTSGVMRRCAASSYPYFTM
jgi:dihydrofolate reductase